ncbi:hypothetical protein PPS11_02898 [Pseudomonas putida S11]|nr:hypothetical protein PPS11_02898 [Pseudomonas putida S11]
MGNGLSKVLAVRCADKVPSESTVKNLSKDISWSQHDIFAPRIEINEPGDRAVAHFNLVCLLTMRSDVADAKGEAFLLAGNYTDHLVKVNGEWLFQSMTGTIEQSSPWTKGWVEAPFKKRVLVSLTYRGMNLQR